MVLSSLLASFENKIKRALIAGKMGLFMISCKSQTTVAYGMFDESKARMKSVETIITDMKTLLLNSGSFVWTSSFLRIVLSPKRHHRRFSATNALSGRNGSQPPSDTSHTWVSGLSAWSWTLFAYASGRGDGNDGRYY